jgi:hypothetical protein
MSWGKPNPPTDKELEAVMPKEPPKYYQLIARCVNCRKEAPIYFEHGKRIEWKTIKKTCNVCGIDAGWVASE